MAETGFQNVIFLGIETSCDETAAAVVRAEIGGDHTIAERAVLGELTLSQLADHRPYGGVVPEIAARAHLVHLQNLVRRTMDEARLGFADLDGVAATSGPGLVGGLMVGLTLAKGVALAAGRPCLAINHLEAHALSARLTERELDFPYLLLLVSGGHCQILLVSGVGSYRVLGTTIDDAVGEAFDKVAKMMGLSYPGGPEIELRALKGRRQAFDLPRPMLGRDGADFSFAGLKTAVRLALVRRKAAGGVTDDDIADMAASFQSAVGDVLGDRVANAIRAVRAGEPAAVGLRHLVVAGGVAANGFLRTRLADCAAAAGLTLLAPPLRYCTDNGAMIAWAGIERFMLGARGDPAAPVRPRWPLAEMTAPAA